MLYTDEKLYPLPYRYLPQDFDITQWDGVKAYYEQLCALEPQNREELISLIEKASEIQNALSDELSWRYIRMTINADDEALSNAYNDFYGNVYAQTDPFKDSIRKIYANSPFRAELEEATYGHLNKIIDNELKLFREENIPLMVQESELANRYGNLVSQMTANMDGEEKTVAQLSVYLKDQDRQKRQEAWQKRMNCYLEKSPELNKLYDEMKELRVQIAANTGFSNYRDYMHNSKGRFSYTPDDLIEFHNSVAKMVVPFVSELNQKRLEKLGVESLKPWDLAVDLDGKKLQPFETTEEFVRKALIILNKVNPEYARQLEMMNNSGLLDLENRKGKAPGGYNTTINNLASSFIFMNHVKLHNDVVTLLHEAGHAMHSTATKDIKIDYYCDVPSEVAELASMSMELLTMDYWDEYYRDEQDYKKAKRDQLEGTLSFLPWCMTVDAFQHWIYLNPQHSPEQRSQAFIDIHKRFYPDVDWEGLTHLREVAWMPQLHIFEVPFYYIEYGIAQLGALSIYMNYRHNRAQALQQYQDFLRLGYSKPVDQVFAAAGIPFDFSEKRIGELVGFVRSELALLGE